MGSTQYDEMLKSGGGGDWITASTMTGFDSKTLNWSRFSFQAF